MNIEDFISMLNKTFFHGATLSYIEVFELIDRAIRNAPPLIIPDNTKLCGMMLDDNGKYLVMDFFSMPNEEYKFTRKMKLPEAMGIISNYLSNLDAKFKSGCRPAPFRFPIKR